MRSQRRTRAKPSFTLPRIPEEEIRAEQVRQIYHDAPIGLLASGLNSIIVYILMKDVTPDAVMELWQGALLAVVAGRALLILSFRRVQRNFPPAVWGGRYMIGVALTGLAWGSLGMLPFTFSITHQVFLAFVLGGMAAGASSTFSRIRHAFPAFAIPALVPITIHFFLMEDSFHVGMGGMGAVFLFAMWYIARHNYRMNRDSLLLRHEHRDTIEILRRANEEVAALNEELSREIDAKLEAERELKEHHRQLARMVEERTAELICTNEQLKTEIEERKAVEGALRESRERLVLAQKAGRVGVFDWDMRTGQVVVTAELEELLGFEPGGALREYRAWADRVYPPDLQRIEEDLARWQEERVIRVEFEYRIAGAGEAIRWMATTAEISYDAQGTALCMIGTSVDITEMKEAQESLHAAKNAAEAASRAKSQFLANMSHEMRTPLAGVLGMIRLVLDTAAAAEERELLEMAHRSGESLLRLIEDVLDFSRLEAGEMRFDRKPFRVAEMVRSAVEVVSLSARERGITLSWRVEETVPREIEGDSGRVRQVLVNLVGNALKFTEQGRIEVTVRAVEGSAGEGGGILFSVQDTGVGIPSEEQERIFEEFTQVDASLTRRHGGTGLGLALSRQIVERMGGRIWVESSAGAGSTFYFTIPAPPCH